VQAAEVQARADIVSHSLTKTAVATVLDRAVLFARDALLARQSAQGYWCFELEADCTIPAEYIMMMHFLDEIDVSLERKLAVYLRSHQGEHGGWPLYHGGDLNISCTIKAYYALKLAGDDPEAPHMARARAAILARGGAARANVFTRIALALFGQLPWRGVPYIPVEIMLLPKWFPFHLDKVAYWSRTVMVPLFILCTRKPKAKNPRQAGRCVGPRIFGRRSSWPPVGSFRPPRHARACDAACRGMDARKIERRGRTRGDFPCHGQCAGSDDHTRLSRRRSAAGHR
jgi:squalene-hopene/tetraprenyl-beta-curcumene cyclase